VGDCRQGTARDGVTRWARRHGRRVCGHAPDETPQRRLTSAGAAGLLGRISHRDRGRTVQRGTAQFSFEIDEECRGLRTPLDVYQDGVFADIDRTSGLGVSDLLDGRGVE
jgi:hypothetical protein